MDRKARRRLAEALRSLPWDLARGESAGSGSEAIECVKRTRSRRVLRVAPRAIPSLGAVGGENRCGYFAKRYANKYPWRRVEWLVGLSKAAGEARVATAVAARGFVVAEPIAWTADFAASYLLTRELPGLRALDDELAAIDPDRRRALWRSAGAFTRRVWEAGIFHPDYLAEHVCLVDDDLDRDARRFALLDLDGVRIGRNSRRQPSMARRAFNAMQLLRSTPAERGDPADRRAFLAEAFRDEWRDDAAQVEFAVRQAARREQTEIHLGA